MHGGAKTLLFEASFASNTISLMNYGKLFVIKLDSDGVAFINKVIVHVATQCSEELLLQADEVKVAPGPVEAGFRFDDTTPNIRDKVVWDPNRNSWKLLLQKNGHMATSHSDVDGYPLSVAEDLDAAGHNAAKFASYVRAIKAWNYFDAGKRQRIAVPFQFRSASTSSLEEATSAASATFVGLTDDSLQNLTDDSPPS